MSALLETLVEKKVLNVREVRALLGKAIGGIARYAQTSVGYDASSMIATMMHDRFPPGRGASGA